jgi:flagellar biosynthesis/type III secretory pathway M-ring protein FliF/YscJ
MPLTKNTNVVVVPASKASQETNDIRPIKPPEQISAGWEWLIWFIIFIVSAIIVAYMVRKLRKKQDESVIKIVIPPHIKARQRIEQAKKYLSEPRIFCFEISNALRVYLEERFNLRAPERTTEEFLADLQNTNVLISSQKSLLEDFLTRCDLVKFARYEPTEQDLLELQESALKLVDETTPYGEQVGKKESVAT